MTFKLAEVLGVNKSGEIKPVYGLSELEKMLKEKREELAKNMDLAERNVSKCIDKMNEIKRAGKK